MARMSITDEAWTIEGLVAHWISQEWGEILAQAAAGMERAWMIGQIGKRLPGWDYDSLTGAFHGPARADALDVVTALAAESKVRITGEMA